MPLISPPQPPQTGAAAMGPAASPPPAQAASRGFDLADLKHYLHIVIQRMWLVALCFVISLGVSVYTLLRQVDTYESSARLLLSAGLPGERRLQLDEAAEMSRLGGDFFATQIQILSSRALRNKARQLSSYPPSVLDANVLNTRVFQVWMTSMLQISVTSLDPAVGADYANSMARAYEDFRAEERLSLSQGTMLSLMQQANRLKDELSRAEERLLDYRREHRVLGMQEKSNLAEEAMAQLARRAIGYRLERLLLETQQPMLKDAPSDVVLKTLVLSAAPPDRSAPRAEGSSEEAAPPGQALLDQGILQVPTWESLRREQELLQSELVSLRKDFREAHPRIQEAVRKSEEVERKLQVEVEFARRQFHSQLESLRIREEAALHVEKEWEEEALGISRKAFEYAALDREVARLRRMNDLIYDRLREVDVATSFDPGSVRILEEAVPAGSPKSPRKLKNLFLASMIGIGIGLGLVFGLEFLDDSLRYPEEVGRTLGLPFFGVVPAADWDNDRLPTHLLANLDPKSPLTEAYRAVRSSLLFAASQTKMQLIAVLSAVPREGKTTTSLNFAISLASAGSRVLLVDADLRRGELHKFFSLEGGRGLADVLMGQAKPESVVQRSGIPGLDIVATGPFPPTPAEAVLRPEFDGFLEYARRNYDRVVLDCPPVMAVSEAPVLAARTDAVLFVVWGGKTARKTARMAVQILQEKGARIVGCVLNNLDLGRVGYYYYSGYYYDSYYRPEERAGDVTSSI